MSKAENPNQGQTKIIIQGDSGFEYQGKKYHFQDMGELQFDSRELRDIDLLEKKRIVNLQKLFTPEGMDLIIAEIQKEVADFSADISTKEGRAKIISMAAKVAKCKSPIKNLASELKEESRRLIDGVNAQWNRYEAAMDNLRDEIRKPVDEIEEKEAAWLETRQNRLAEIENFRSALYSSGAAVDLYKGSIDKVKRLSIFDWSEFAFKAETTASEIIVILEERLAAAIKYEEEQAELSRLRKEAAERAQKDHEEKIAREAAERERKAAIEREAKIEADKKAAEERAKEAERLAIEQAEKAELARIAAAKKAKEDAEKAALEAVEKERLRVAEEKRKEDEAAERLAADKEHRAKIEKEILETFDLIIESDGWDGDSRSNSDRKEGAKIILEAIAKGEVPHVQINY